MDSERNFYSNGASTMSSQTSNQDTDATRFCRPTTSYSFTSSCSEGDRSLAIARLLVGNMASGSVDGYHVNIGRLPGQECHPYLMLPPETSLHPAYSFSPTTEGDSVRGCLESNPGSLNTGCNQLTNLSDSMSNATTNGKIRHGKMILYMVR